MSKIEHIEWFWAHRRNTSLHHMSMFGEGLRGKGYLPLCDFSFDHQLYLGVPGKGCYIYYDRRQLSQTDCYRRIQRSADANPDFVPRIHQRTEELFKVVFLRCEEIDQANLELLSNDEIITLYDAFIQGVTAGPMLSVQLWGIEALLQPKYKILQFLRQKFQGKDRTIKVQEATEVLLTNIGETVAFSEQRDFLHLAARISKNKRLLTVFLRGKPSSIEVRLRRYPREDGWIDRHIKKYAWVNSEYVSGVWPKTKWLGLIQQTLQDNVPPATRLNRLEKGFRNSMRHRQRLLSKLNPPKDVLHAIEALAEFVAQRDWSKGYFAKALLSYQRLLDEIARRIDENQGDVLNYSSDELQRALTTGQRLKRSVISARRTGYIILNKTSMRKVISGKVAVARTLKRERVPHPNDVSGTSDAQVQGLPANGGKAVGIAHVIDDPKDIPKFREGEILITYMTTMEFTPIFRKAAAVITDEGGMSSHAAIVSREFDLPCIVGTNVSTKIFRTGDLVKVDGTRGIIHRANRYDA